jgi:hypothetical protein
MHGKELYAVMKHRLAGPLPHPPHTTIFRLFHRAILGRQLIACTQRGHYREICPHVLGHKNGREAALVYQFGGTSSQPLPPQGAWRCFYLADVEDVRVYRGPWRTGSEHRKTQSCVDEVYIDVNTDVPNQPGRR